MAFEKFVLLLFTTSIVLVGGIDESVLIVAIPQNSGSNSKVLLSWERGKEILLGALEAVNHINSNSDQLGLLCPWL